MSMIARSVRVLRGNLRLSRKRWNRFSTRMIKGRRNTVRAAMVAQAAPTSSMRGMCSAEAMGGPQENMGGASPGP